jgi:hypothetical protein
VVDEQICHTLGVVVAGFLTNCVGCLGDVLQVMTITVSKALRIFCVKRSRTRELVYPEVSDYYFICQVSTNKICHLTG